MCLSVCVYVCLYVCLCVCVCVSHVLLCCGEAVLVKWSHNLMSINNVR